VREGMAGRKPGQSSGEALAAGVAVKHPP
jgi:hypothetical protein